MSRAQRQQQLLEVFAIPAASESDPSIFTRVGRPTADDGAVFRRRRLGNGETFSVFNPDHMAEAEELYQVLIRETDMAGFVRAALSERGSTNAGLFAFAVSRAHIDLPFSRDLLLPPIHELFPDKFIPSDTINRAIKLYLDRTHEDPGNETPLKVTVDTIGSPHDVEYRVAYFREDTGLNSHHWHWHLVYPYNARPKDRQGEIFYYSHQQLCARYDCERLSVGLGIVEPLRHFDEPLVGYSPHLMDLNTGKSNASRPDGMRIPQFNHMLRWRERIFEAIHLGYLVDTSGGRIQLDGESGIDLLGAVVEPQAGSRNRDYYGSMHNTLHDSIASVHDPTGKFQEMIGVIGDNTTAVRDPAFFLIHKFIDDVFNEHKMTLPPYTMEELIFPDIQVVEVVVEGGKEPNVIPTFMGKATMRLDHAIRMKIPVEVEYEHLNHEEFTYKIKAQNRTRSNRDAMVRIFMGPRFDEIGRDFPVNVQRRLFIEMDKFHVKLVPGENIFTRKSTRSSVALQFNPSFQDLKDQKFSDQQNELITNSYCSCGWPQHLLVPRGNPNGMPFRLFVMLTDFTQDFVGSRKETCRRGANSCGGKDTKEMFKGAVSYCGAKDSKYPDKRAMGFPFDRNIPNPDEFVTPNMSFTDVRIQFKRGNA